MRAAQAKKHKVSIYGDTHLLVSDETEEHLLQVSQKVDSLMQDIASRASCTDGKRVAVLAALHVVSAALKEKEQCQAIVRRIDHLIADALNSCSSCDAP